MYTLLGKLFNFIAYQKELVCILFLSLRDVWGHRRTQLGAGAGGLEMGHFRRKASCEQER